MTLRFFEGFEGLGSTEGPANRLVISAELRRTMSWSSVIASSEVFLRPGQLQGKALAFNNTSGTPTKVFLPSPIGDLTGNEFVIGFRWKPSSLFTSGTNDFMQIYHEQVTGTAQITLRLNFTNHTIELFRGSTSLEESASDVWAADEWFHVELKLLIADGTGGSYTVCVNGTEVLAGSSLDTLHSATLLAVIFQFTGTAAAGDDTAAKETHIDDIYFLDTTGSINNDFLGPNARVVIRAPDTDGTTNDFTPQTGTDNFAMVDENPASAADYNDGAVNGDIDEYGIIAVEQDTIYGVAIETHLTPDVQGRERTFRHRVRSSASIGNGADVKITDDVNKRTVFEVDPNTSSLWTKANVNLAEFGVEVRD